MIETPRLLLRDFKKTDWKEVHEYAIDEDVVRFMEWGPNTSDETINFVDTAILHQKERQRRCFELAVTLKESGRLIGSAGIRVLPGERDQADFGYCFNKQYWRQGFATETSCALIRFGFARLNLHRIYALCDLENVGSAGVLRKAGLRQEGHFRQDKKIKGRWRDTLLFAILREEWNDHSH